MNNLTREAFKIAKKLANCDLEEIRSNIKHSKSLIGGSDVNKATKNELFNAIKEKFNKRSFTHKQCLRLLDGFNHSSKIYVLLTKLVEDKKLKLTDNKYKVIAGIYFNIGDRVEGKTVLGWKFTGVISNRRFHTANSNLMIYTIECDEPLKDGRESVLITWDIKANEPTDDTELKPSKRIPRDYNKIKIRKLEKELELYDDILEKYKNIDENVNNLRGKQKRNYIEERKDIIKQIKAINPNYKVKSMITTETFVRNFCKGKDLPVARVRLEIAVTRACGNCITSNNREKAISVIRETITKKKVLSSVGMQCPRCNNKMTPVVLSNKRNAWYCSNDRVSLPR